MAQFDVGDNKWTKDCAQKGVAPHAMRVFVRSEAELDRARGAVELAALLCKVLDANVETSHGQVSVSTTSHFSAATGKKRL